MAADKATIKYWFDQGVSQGATHMIVCCDTFDYEDYPSYVMPEQDVQKALKHCQSQDMTRVMEVYNLSMNKDKQFSERRAWNF